MKLVQDEMTLSSQQADQSEKKLNMDQGIRCLKGNSGTLQYRIFILTDILIFCINKAILKK